eukprot:10873016-Alexandrium_andersonii.AAC.1
MVGSGGAAAPPGRSPAEEFEGMALWADGGLSSRRVAGVPACDGAGSGGLPSRGEPLAATGIRMAVYAFLVRHQFDGNLRTWA